MKTSRIELRVTEEEKKKIDNKAKKDNLKTATFIRKVILDYIEKEECN